MSTWEDRIRTRMKELGMTQEDLAAKLGITRGAVTHYLAGRRVPPLKQFQRMAAVLKADPAWLQFGANAEAPTPQKASKYSKPEATYRPIPILSWEQAAKRPDVSRMKPVDISSHIPHIFTDQANWYALRVKGDSMTAASGSKRFHDGDIILVDPDKEPAHGDFVIAILPRTKEITFKQYVVDGGVKYLKPLNTQYPLLKFEKGTDVIAVVRNNMII